MQTEITFTASDGKGLPGVLTVPDGATGAGPALLMIYEAFGMTDEMRRVARDLAADGYTVLIPDLFARGPAKAICVARALRTTQRGEGRELDDLESARHWLAERPEVDGERIGTIGFCLGGSFALLLARTGRYKVSAPFYSGRIDLPTRARSSRASVAATRPPAAIPSGSKPVSKRSTCPTTWSPIPKPGTRSSPGPPGCWAPSRRAPRCTPSTTRPAPRTRTGGSSRSSGSTSAECAAARQDERYE
jgi:dienelactone hydrolase